MFALFCQNIYASVGVVISGSQLSLFVSVCLWIFCINAVDSGKTGLKISFGTFHFLVHLYSSAAINIAIELNFSGYTDVVLTKITDQQRTKAQWAQ